ncbi:cyanase [Komagataeibacter oboediens]|uniref:cyanase n=1 Tax=Komagataeibacter oboediens TaxID=65958 RepID=UPI001C2CA645|nr:cyanase [Komagataeibacter oboediens]MBV0890035.1 cyanase [Komagataeibacter oboediens]MCK9821058.1 cyanase [Komagataeibacter oboediens]
MPVFESREDVTHAIIAARVARGIRWADVATAVGRSKEWTTAACFGQMTFSAGEAEALVALLELDPSALPWLQTVPYKGTLGGGAPDDPLLYRWYEMISVYGPAIKELIHEEFGDGIMSAIDFKMHIEREPDPAGDRVHVNISGKFLPYKKY